MGEAYWGEQTGAEEMAFARLVGRGEASRKKGTVGGREGGFLKRGGYQRSDGKRS